MNDRQKRILELLNHKGRISVTKLAQKTSVSEVTIRNDLTFLENQGYLKRVHGSAITLDSDNVNDRMLLNFPMKQALAQFAASQVQAGDTVFIEGGSANAILARELASQSSVTIITVSFYIASLLKDAQCEVVLLGGLLQKKSESVVGPLTRACIQQIHFNKAFVGIDGFHPESGFTGRDMMRTEIINAVLSKGAQNIVISDSSKFGQIHLYGLEPQSAISRLITDDALPNEYERYLSDMNITVDKVMTRH
jgi:DeoR/GlpR family transcriptional regulator of sugar metabolism